MSPTKTSGVIELLTAREEEEKEKEEREKEKE